MWFALGLTNGMDITAAPENMAGSLIDGDCITSLKQDASLLNAPLDTFRQFVKPMRDSNRR